MDFICSCSISESIYPDAQIYILFAVCIAILSILCALVKDTAEVSVDNWILSSIVSLPLAHVLLNSFWNLGTCKGRFLDLFNLGVHIGSLFLVLLMIVAVGRRIRKVKDQELKRSIRPIPVSFIEQE